MNAVLTLFTVAVLIEGTYAVGMKVKEKTVGGMTGVYDAALMIAAAKSPGDQNAAIKTLGARIAGL